MSVTDHVNETRSLRFNKIPPHGATRAESRWHFTSSSLGHQG